MSAWKHIIRISKSWQSTAIQNISGLCVSIFETGKWRNQFVLPIWKPTDSNAYRIGRTAIIKSKASSLAFNSQTIGLWRKFLRACRDEESNLASIPNNNCQHCSVDLEPKKWEYGIFKNRHHYELELNARKVKFLMIDVRAKLLVNICMLILFVLQKEIENHFRRTRTKIEARRHLW